VAHLDLGLGRLGRLVQPSTPVGMPSTFDQGQTILNFSRGHTSQASTYVNLS